MKTVADFPYFEVQFTKDGAVFDPAEVTALTEFVSKGAVHDLFVISHGWNNDMDDARKLYAAFLERVRAVLNRHVVPGADARLYAVMAVLWPSKKFADEELIPSGAAALGSAVSASFVQQQVDELRDTLQTPAAQAALDRARALVPALVNSPKAQEEFVNLIRSTLPSAPAEIDDASSDFFTAPGKVLIDRLAKPTTVAPVVQSTGGAAAIGAGPRPGAAAGIGQTFSGILSGARNLLNYSTYYLMKDRAGTVGRKGVSGILRQLLAIPSAQPLRIHLIGHSFGGRLVTAVADGPSDQPALTFQTMTLLQAAFSHNGLGAKFDGTHDGAFRSIVTQQKVRGPILITHSIHDRAVGVAYPLASRIAGQDAAALGDANDRFGGMGRNGAQHTPERVVGTLQSVGQAYTFESGKIYNLNSDGVIEEHSDICHDEVAYALLTAVA